MKTITPVIIDDLLTNPGVGFIAAPGLMENPDEVRDNRGNPVDKYKFTPDARTWNHPDSGVYYCGGRWKDLEPQKGEYQWQLLDEKLEAAGRMGCLAVVRCAPYALLPEEDIPAWLRARWPDEPEYPFWRIDPNATDYAAHWADFVRAFAARYDGHPLISSVDMAIVGAWGEGAGSEFMEPGKLDEIIRAYIEGFAKTPLQCLLHDPKSVANIRRYRAKVGFRVDCLGDMGGFNHGQWSHMLDFYPQNIVNFNMQDAWKKAPVVFEACWHMNDWYLQGWDIDYIVDESLKWHISSYNSKGTTVPAAWQDSVTRWVRRMGYRFEIPLVRFGKSAAAGGNWPVELLVNNSGVAPCYHNYPPILRLTHGDASYDLPLAADIREWLPGEDHLLSQSLRLPQNLPAGTCRVSLGFPVPAYAHKTLALAIAGRGKDGFYPLGEVEIS